MLGVRRGGSRARCSALLAEHTVRPSLSQSVSSGVTLGTGLAWTGRGENNKMFDLIFGSVSGLFHKWDSACIDNHIFRLHYRASVIILLGAIALVKHPVHSSPVRL